MKTRGLSILSGLLLAAMMGGTGPILGHKPNLTLHSHGSFHKRGKFKGWMRENRKCTFNKRKRAA